MGSIACGNCDHGIKDIGRTEMGALFTDDNYIDGGLRDNELEKHITVYECRECGALTMLWNTWGEEEHQATYLPKSGKDNELTWIKHWQYAVEKD